MNILVWLAALNFIMAALNIPFFPKPQNVGAAIFSTLVGLWILHGVKYGK